MLNIHAVTKTPARALQRGVMLLEALLGILIFSIGILALIAMQAAAISAQSDAQVRVEAANLASKLLSKVWVNVNRTNIAGSLNGATGFEHQPSEGAWCQFSGTQNTNPIVTDWINEVVASGATKLPGTAANRVSIAVDTTTTGYNKVTVSICWKSSTDLVERKHVMIAHIN
jgi:type IV pilus assembly protein PilV